ncbi:MAG: hypothetical protein DRQ57_03140 [Gammaproteobacteria bacterium]|nr:MAG: hypothetical protein DRQ57_03140 [Gammaproteobacteria bacterium]
MNNIEQLKELQAIIINQAYQFYEAVADMGAKITQEAIHLAQNYVMKVGEASAAAKLKGLPIIVQHTQQNLAALQELEASQRQLLLREIERWPKLVLNYLYALSNQNTGHSIIGYFQNSIWPQPCTEQLSTELNESFTHDFRHLANKNLVTILAESELGDLNLMKESVGEASYENTQTEVANPLYQSISSMSNTLSSALIQMLTLDVEHEAFIDQVEQYTDSVQSLWELAEELDFKGLQEVCTFINDNVFAAASSQPQSVRFEQLEPLALCPKLLLDYLQSPELGAPKLVEWLYLETWPVSISPDARPNLLSQLKQDCSSPIVCETDCKGMNAFIPEKALELTLGDKKQNQLEENALSIPNAQLLIEQMSQIAKINNQCLNELIAADDGTESLLMATITYTENVQTVWDAAEGVEGLQAICTFINDNVMILGSQSKSSREAARELLASWPELIIGYFYQPVESASALISLLQQSEWPTPLDKEMACEIEARLIEESKPSSGEEIKSDVSNEESAEMALLPLAPRIMEEIEEVSEDFIELVTPDLLELVCSQISDSSEGLSAALEVCVSMENDNPAFFEAIEDYTNRVQDIWDVAEMVELKGLQEVCTFINENLLAFSIQEQTTRVATQKYFQNWPALVLEYLQFPTKGAPRLVNYLQEADWPSPLTVESGEQLLGLLKTPSGGGQGESGHCDFVETVTDVPDLPLEELAPLPVSVDETISLGNAEVVEILSSELESAEADLEGELKKFISAENNTTLLNEATETYIEHVHRLYVASEMMGLDGLQTICTQVMDNVKVLSAESIVSRQKALSVLEPWPNLVLAYLKSPGDKSVGALVTHFRAPTWVHALSDEAALNLLNQLVVGTTVDEEAEESDAYSRPSTTTPEDVLITVPEDINQELLEAYLQEVPQNAADFSTCIQNIIQSPDISEIERAQRIAHTLKGSSNIIGIKGVANIAHHLEDTLEYLAKHQVVPPQELTDTMTEAADCLEIMVDALLGQDDPPPQAQQVLQSVLDWANRIDKGKLDGPPSKPLSEKVPAAVIDKQATPEKVDKQIDNKALGTPEQFLKVPTKTIDELMRLVGELSISVGQIQDKLKHVTQSTRTLTMRDLTLQKKTFELENLVDVRGITGIDNRKQISSQDEHFDPLEFEEYNELHSVAHSFIEFIADNRELAKSIREDMGELDTMFIHQERLNKEFQANIMTTRMVPVNTILSKVQRNVRQTCRMTGKKTELDVSGTDILIDSDVLSHLGEPLQHILRNAIDHGIEAPDERVILGKPESGKIKLSFYREGNNVVVSCQDDGQGLNYTNIRFTAIQRGLITESQKLTEQDLGRLILMSGFSTKSGVTQVSGRGVGMDVVHTSIRQMKGTLDLHSQTGVGTSILIKLPMTLVTVHVLLVRIGERRFGIPTNHLEQALAPGTEEFLQVGDEITLKKDKNFYALKSLAKLLNMPDDMEITEQESRSILLVHEETGISAVLVDELLETHDLVMKSMGKYVTNIRGVTGASILGDGSLVPLLDLPELLRSGTAASMPIAHSKGQVEEGIAAAQAIPHIMIVDDSLSVRKSLSLLVEDAGFEILLAKDGLEAIEVMEQTRPNVMLVDMEMPRMNGLELTAHVRANQAMQNLPIFMITSRTTEKHREQAKAAGVNAYLTKPYQESELLALIDKALAGQV